MQSPRIWEAKNLPKLPKIPIAIHWQVIIETSLEFLMGVVFIHDVAVSSNVHQESKPQLHPNPRKNRDTISTSKNGKLLQKKAMSNCRNRPSPMYIDCSNAQTSKKLEALPLGSPVVDAAGLPPDARIASYYRVAAAIHFANNVLVGYNNPSPISTPAGRTEGA